ncbi:Vesicle-associated protein 1-2 [Galdieria sulphuraria]|nr:Vesicle-associated protein 1-2 [Galdieria sulphuraria]
MDSVVKLSTKQLDLFVESGKPASTSLTVENISKSYVCFKVKTTQPQRYSVRPSVGIIKPGERKDVLITLEPLKDIPEDLKANVHELWKKEDTPTERYTEGVSKGSEAYTSIYSDRFASDPLVGNGAVKQDKTKEDSKLPIDLNDSSRFTLERINLSTASSPRLLEKNHSLISLEERYQLALERIHVLNTELALRDLELEKLRDSKYGREEYRNSASSSSYEENDSEVLTARDGHFQETGEPHNRVKSSRKNTNNGLVGNIGFSVIQVFLIVLISFFFGKYLSIQTESSFVIVFETYSHFKTFLMQLCKKGKG